MSPALLLASLLLGHSPHAQSCVTAGGNTACGYHCVAAYGQAACARTRAGACKAAYGQVTCWDPEEGCDREAECKAAYGQIACGYHCTAAFGEVRCAPTPDGACSASNGHVTCSD